MNLDGPSRRIISEPIEQPSPITVPAPAEPGWGLAPSPHWEPQIPGRDAAPATRS